MGATDALLGILAAPWIPRRLSSGVVRAYASWHARQVARADRGAGPQPGSIDVGGPIYLLDGFHGGIPFWDWLLLPAGGLWKELLWPAVGEVLVRRSRELGLPALLEIDGYTFSVMADQQPEAVARLKECVTAGTIEVVNGTYAQPFLRTLSGESIIRQFAHGLDAIESALSSSVTSYASQEPCFCTQLPQILAGFGFERALVRTHWAPFGEEAAHDAPLVRWQGPDGSQVMAVPRHSWMDYGTRRDLHPGALRGNLTGAHASEWAPEDLRRFRAAAVQRGSDPPLISSLEDLSPFEAPTAAAPALNAVPDVHLTKLEDYCEMVLAGQRVEDLPLWEPAPDGFPLDLPWGLEGDRLMRVRDEAEAALLVAERANALVQMLQDPESTSQRTREGELAEAWEKLLTAQHHDLHVCGPWLSRAHGKSVSDVGVDLCAQAEETAGNLTHEVLSCFLQRVDTTEFEGQPVLVFNPTARATRAVIKVAGYGVAFDEGRSLPTQSTKNGGAVLDELPPLGWRVIDVRSGVPPGDSANDNAFEFDHGLYHATLSKAGALTLSAFGRTLMQDGATLSLWRDGRWWASPGSPNHESPDLESPSRHLGIAGPVYRRWLVQGTLAGIPFTQTFTLSQALPRVDVTVSLDFRGAAFGPQPGDGDGYYAQDERKLCACFPMTGRHRVVHDAPFLTSETDRSRFIGGRWAAVEGDGVGLAVLAAGARGYTFDRDSGVLRRVLAWSPESWIYASDNSITGGGSRYTTLSRRCVFRYALLPYQQRSEVRAESDQYRLPPVAIAGERSAGDLPTSGSLLDIEGDGVALSALFVQGGKPYARLWNASGSEQEVVIHTRGGGDLAAVGLRLEGGERLPGGRLSLRPWGVQTVRLLDSLLGQIV